MGGKLRVNGRGHGVNDLRKEYDADALLTLAAKATADMKELAHA